VAEDGERAGAGAVGLDRARLEDEPHQVMILAHRDILISGGLAAMDISYGTMARGAAMTHRRIAARFSQDMPAP
jgi:hypothetical protein